MTAPTIQFVVPFYGRADYLRSTVDSLLKQTETEWTAVVLDDHFPDPAASAWVAEVGDPRLRLVRNARNLGVNRNFQRALDLADSDYVVICGGDDRFLPEYVARVRELVRDTGATVVQPGVRTIDHSGAPTTSVTDRVKSRLRPRGPARVHSGERLAVSLLTGNWTYFPSLAWQVDAVARIGFREDYVVVQDLALLLDVVARGGTLAVDPTVVFEYRRHSASLSSVAATDGSRFSEELAYFRAAADEMGARGWTRAQRAAHLRLMSRAHAVALLPRAGDLASAGHLARHALS